MRCKYVRLVKIVIIAAVQSSMTPKSSQKVIADPFEPSKRAKIATICKKVLTLANLETGMLNLILARNSLIPATINSRATISIQGISGALLNFTNINKILVTKILSAIGSNILPKLDSKLYFLAT